MEYKKVIDSISPEKWGPLSDQLTAIILKSKNDEKMPSQLANTILLFMKNGMLDTEQGLTSLLEAALLMNPEKTFTILGELKISNFEAIKQKMPS